MNKEIEEMAKIMFEGCGKHCNDNCPCFDCEYKNINFITNGYDCTDYVSAEALYEAGYRKVANKE